MTVVDDAGQVILSIPDVEFGLAWIEGLGREQIKERVRALTGWTVTRRSDLQHRNGRPIVRLYGPAGTDRRGGTIAFNVPDPGGGLVDERLIAAEATKAGLSLHLRRRTPPARLHRRRLP